MRECPFCSEVATSAQNVFHESEDGLFAARWDLFPVTPGHVEVIPVRHVQYFEELTPEEISGLLPYVRRVIEIIKATDLPLLYEELVPLEGDAISRELVAQARHQSVASMPDAYNFGINDGVDAGQSVPHLHLHIMPRWKGDMENPRGGVRNMFIGDRYSSIH